MRFGGADRGEHVRVGLLDSGVALDCGAFGANVAALDSEGRAAPNPPRSHGTSCAEPIASTDARAGRLRPQELRCHGQVGSAAGRAHRGRGARRRGGQVPDLSCSFVVREQSPLLLDAFRQALESGVVQLRPEMTPRKRRSSPRTSQAPSWWALTASSTSGLARTDRIHGHIGAWRGIATMLLGIVGFLETSAATALAAGLFAAVLSAAGRPLALGTKMDQLGAGVRRVPRRRACLPVAWTR